MSYIINETNGNILLTVLDGTADGPNINPGINKSDVNLFGKDYPNYGEFLNENFIKLLQNFSNNTPPSKPLIGELWYDSGTSFLKVYNGTTFTPVSPVIVSTTQPSTIVVGTQWWDQTNQQLKSWNGTSWSLVGPAYSILDGISGAIVETVYDTLGAKHTVVKTYTNGNVVAISSYDQSFTPNVTVPGFSTIAPGINLSAATSTLFTGTATNSQQLGGLLAAQYARKDISETFAGNLNLGGGSITLTSGPMGRAAITNTVLNADISVYTNVAGISTKALTVNGVNGLVTVAANPTTSLGVATKGYVDSSILSATAPLAPTASPILTGTPTSVNFNATDNSTRIATTAFTQAAIAASQNSLWQGSAQFVSASTPDSFTGNVGDFWFQI